jgi:sulfur carrier protein
MIINGVPRQGRSQSLSVSALLTELAIEPRGIAVAINGEIARRSQWETTFIHDDDTIEIVTAVAGG